MICRNLPTSRTSAKPRKAAGRQVTSIEALAELPVRGQDEISDATDRIHGVLAALPDHYRRILELRLLQGRSIKASANHMGITVGNAKVLQHRALRRARSAM